MIGKIHHETPTQRRQGQCFVAGVMIMGSFVLTGTTAALIGSPGLLICAFIVSGAGCLVAIIGGGMNLSGHP